MVCEASGPVICKSQYKDSFFLYFCLSFASVLHVLEVSLQHHVLEPVQRDLTRALQGEGNKTQRDEANILILLS